MPNRDRTGPAGMGPTTGRGMGPCAGDGQNGYGFGAGFGRGHRFGGGRFGRGRGYNHRSYPNMGWGYVPFRAGPDAIDTASYEENEKDFLDREITYLKSELEALEKRHEDLKDKD